MFSSLKSNVALQQSLEVNWMKGDTPISFLLELFKRKRKHYRNLQEATLSRHYYHNFVSSDAIRTLAHFRPSFDG